MNTNFTVTMCKFLQNIFKLCMEWYQKFSENAWFGEKKNDDICYYSLHTIAYLRFYLPIFPSVRPSYTVSGAGGM